MDTINSNKNFEQNDYLKLLEIPYEKNGGVANTILYPQTPFLAQDEELLWTHTDTEGIINAHATWSEALTNFRVFQYNFKTHLANYALISRIYHLAYVIEHILTSSFSYPG